MADVKIDDQTSRLGYKSRVEYPLILNPFAIRESRPEVEL